MDRAETERVEQHPLFQRVERVRRHTGKVRGETVTLAHGGGGKAMRNLIQDVFLREFGNPELEKFEDQASFALNDLSTLGNRLAFTTDSYVVDPIFFPGGDIGTLAVNGTVNDLAVGGALPLYLSCGFIIEEGFPIRDLRRVAASIKQAALDAGVTIVAGDTKVVHRGAADKLFINTSGIGVIRNDVDISAGYAQAGDVVIINGSLGDHGVAILAARGDLALETEIESDCQALNGLTEAIFGACREVHCMRDLTRGGLATALNEFALASEVGIRLHEKELRMRPEVVGTCELLGFDPLYLANEGKLAVVAPARHSDSIVEAMHAHPTGREARVIGEVMEAPRGVVLLNTQFGGERIVDMLVGEQLPRIC